MNRVIITGNLTHDPELKTTTTGKMVCTLRVAVNRRFKTNDGQTLTDFFNVVCWRQTAELCARYLAKGRKVGIVGELQTRSYEAKDGTKRYVTEIVADEVEFLTPKSQQPGAEQSEGYDDSEAQASSDDFDDDHLPF